MKYREAFRLAFTQIRSQKLKSAFAVLGVFVGATFLVTVVSVLGGLNRYMEEDFGRRIYGLNTVTVRRIPSVQFGPSESTRREWRRRPRLTFEDGDAVKAQLEVPAIVGVESHNGGEVEGPDGTNLGNIWLTAASSEYFAIRNMDLGMGRAFNEAENRVGSAVVVLGADASDELFGSRDPIGKTIKVRGIPFRVIGVMQKQGSLLGISMDNRAIAPARSPMARLVNPHGIVDEIVVKTQDEVAMGRAMWELEAIMRERRGLRPTDQNDFELETAEDSMSFWTRISNILYATFPVLVGIALVVGGMVIMNIMLVSVTERTREIGVRKAIGARRRDVVRQVLVESAALSLMGAAAGILFGQVGAQVVRAVTPLPVSIAPVAMFGAALLGIGVGVVAGLYPAVKAASMDPVVALRAE
ncbi:MAG TPA: ABC transporter permease [Longimicrobiales bacterium]|nr:ABC transporter permease [Longimicrobiales bacterium]